MVTVTIVAKQKIFDELYLFETVRDEPIPHKNFMLLGQGSHEIRGGSARPPPRHPMWVAIPLVTEGLKFYFCALYQSRYNTCSTF